MKNTRRVAFHLDCGGRALLAHMHRGAFHGLANCADNIASNGRALFRLRGGLWTGCRMNGCTQTNGCRENGGSSDPLECRAGPNPTLARTGIDRMKTQHHNTFQPHQRAGSAGVHCNGKPSNSGTRSSSF
jgi:hypothetical protein